ncbi:sarcolemmal membrane-associated protein-like [Rhincodon typus]|uniref:sarcolemmal membrane-associated protein-like n=1 Tax=Rhincodon typus TaxID=259920 RepID=UPI00203009B0|nr:sarcolemmal membrane-associated protein-like [Rhincodon typus]
MNPFSQELNQLAEYLQEALQREQLLEQKLETLQYLLTHTQLLSDNVWQDTQAECTDLTLKTRASLRTDLEIRTEHKITKVKMEGLQSTGNQDLLTLLKVENTEGERNDGNETPDSKDTAFPDADMEDGLNKKRRRPTLRKEKRLQESKILRKQAMIRDMSEKGPPDVKVLRQQAIVRDISDCQQLWCFAFKRRLEAYPENISP